MNKLIQDSWDILKKNPNLYTAVILMLFLSDIITPSPSASVFYIVGVIAYGCIGMAVSAGLTNQIKIVLATKEKAKFDDLLTGIGKYFNVILSGNIVLTFAFGLIFLGLYYAVTQLVVLSPQDIEAFKGVYKGLAKLKQEQLPEYLKSIDPHLMKIAYEYFMAFTFYAMVYSLVYFFLGLWTQMCIFKGITWIEAFKKSYRIVKKNLGLYTVLTFIQSIFYIMFLSANFVIGDPFTALFFTILNVVVDTYFAVLYCLFIYRYDEDNKIELITDAIQPPISKI